MYPCSQPKASRNVFIYFLHTNTHSVQAATGVSKRNNGENKWRLYLWHIKHHGDLLQTTLHLSARSNITIIWKIHCAQNEASRILTGSHNIPSIDPIQSETHISYICGLLRKTSRYVTGTELSMLKNTEWQMRMVEMAYNSMQ